MWRLEGDRRLSATFGSVTFLDRSPDPAVVRERIAGAVDAIPRFRQRIDTSGPPTWPGAWVDVEVELDHHLRWVDAPGEGTEAEVLDLAAALVAEPFDPERPPWNFVFVTGLIDGRAALVQRIHHSITDGEGGIALASQFVDFERHPDPLPPLDATGRDATDPVPGPTWIDRLIGTAADRAGDLIRTTTAAARWTAGGVTDPGRFVRLGGEVVETTQSLRRQLLVFEQARSPLWKQHSTDRRVVAGSFPFAPARAAATTSGVSLNDVFVTATVRGVANYHRMKGASVNELRVAIPVSTRSSTRDDEAGEANPGGNAFSPTRVTLPSGDAHTAAAHLQLVSELMRQTKTERATGLVEPLSAIAEIVPASLLRTALVRQAATIDYAASNVRAAPVPLYIGGAMIEATYAIGPLMATAANITMLSYNGRLDLGIHVDTAAVDDPELLRDTVIAAFHEVCAAVAG